MSKIKKHTIDFELYEENISMKPIYTL